MKATAAPATAVPAENWSQLDFGGVRMDPDNNPVVLLREHGGSRVVTMGDASAFLRRMVQVRMHFARQGADYAVHLAQPAGLRGIAFAIPRLRAGTHVAGTHPVGTDAAYSYLAVDGNPDVFDAVIPEHAFVR